MEADSLSIHFIALAGTTYPAFLFIMMRITDVARAAFLWAAILSASFAATVYELHQIWG
jgi:hypothetical protein